MSSANLFEVLLQTGPSGILIKIISFTTHVELEMFKKGY